MKALELDNTLPEAHAHLAMLMASEFDWKEAEIEFLRALELGPGAWEVYHLYSFFYLLPMRRLEQALAAERRAEELDPLSSLIQSGLAGIYTIMGKYDQAISHCATALELDPNSFWANNFLGSAYIHKGEVTEGIRVIEKSASLLGRNAASQAILGWAYASAGRTSEARRLLEELLVTARNAYVPAIYLAIIYMGLGEIEECFNWMFKAAEQRESTILQMFQYPIPDRLRSHPRYMSLLRKMNLEP